MYDIVKWEYEKEQPIDDIILSIKANIENTESLLITTRVIEFHENIMCVGIRTNYGVFEKV